MLDKLLEFDSFVRLDDPAGIVVVGDIFAVAVLRQCLDHIAELGELEFAVVAVGTECDQQLLLPVGHLYLECLNWWALHRKLVHSACPELTDNRFPARVDQNRIVSS